MNFKSALEVIGRVGGEGLGCLTQLLSERPASKRVSVLLFLFLFLLLSSIRFLLLSPFFLPFLPIFLSLSKKKSHLKLKADSASTPAPHLPRAEPFPCQ